MVKPVPTKAFLQPAKAAEVGGGKSSILTANSKCPSIYDFKLVWKGFLGTASVNKVQLTRVVKVGTMLNFHLNWFHKFS